MDLLVEFQRVVGAVEAAGVDYALCGGLAVALHGAPRATRDIDLLVREGDVESVLAALKPLGFTFRAKPMNFADGMRIRRVTRIDGRDLLTVDLILVGPETEEAFEARQIVATEGGRVAVKVWAGRPQDLADVQRLADDDR